MRRGLRILYELLVAARPRQWIKNLLLFAALVFAHQLGDLERGTRAVLAFGLFCAASSAIYLANDLVDREHDRAHPDKRRRPIAAGRLPAPVAGAASAVLAGTALLGCWALGRPLGIVATAFLGLNALYVLWLRHVLMLDVLAIAISFMLRAVAGAAAIDVPASSWLIVLTLFLALFLAVNKRRAELARLGPEAARHRPVLAHYTPELLDQLGAACTAGVIQMYALYSFNSEVQPEQMVWSLPLVLYGVFRYLYLVQRRGQGSNVEEALLGDPPLLACVLLWVALMLVLTARLPSLS